MNSKQTWPVLLLFFCSGATALIYEVVWSKYLSQMFGSTIYAQTVVLAVFMGGLALGNRWFGAKSHRLARPVRAYAFVELGIGLYAFFFPQIFAAADKIFETVGAAVLERSGLLLALKGALSLGLLIVPTILMGGTLPLLADFLQRSSLEAGRQSARFYSVNSLGAVAGSAVAGFYLVQQWGMIAALQLSALVNLGIAAAALMLSRQLEADRLTSPTPPTSSLSADPESPSPAHEITLRSAGLLVALTGGVSMGLEVLASRLLALLFGSSLQSFAIVLCAFILGIGLGSAVMASPRLRRWNSPATVTILLLSAALWIGLLVFRIESWVQVYRVLCSGLGRSTTGYLFYQLLAAAIAMIVLGGPAAMIGAVLPLLIRTVSDTRTRLSEHVGRLLTWNTLGAVVGVLLTGFFVMPTFGLRNAFLVLALGLAVAALVASLRQQLRRGTAGAGAVGALLLLFMSVGNEGWRHVMSSGVFRSRETEVNPDVMALRKKHIKIHFYEDAPDATVNIEQGDGVNESADIGLRLNGKTDASSHADLGTQLLLAHIPLAACPEAKDVFILGLGSGITGGAVLGHPIERLTIAENCEPVIRAAAFFSPWNRGVLTNPVTRIWNEDARTVLKLSSQEYDVIITQPSNPWMVGVGSVFSREYYELAARRLKNGGIMAQWFHVYEMHDGIVNLVLRTFSSVFPHVEIWDSGSGDLILLGGMRPWASAPSVYRRLFERESPRKDFARVGIKSPEALWARQLASQQTAFAIAGPGPVQSDLFPVLEYEAPRAFFIGRNARELAKFDERTWQTQLAPRDKQQALGALDDPALMPVFAQYSSINEELCSHLHWRFHHGVGCTAEFRPAWPCVFRSNDYVVPKPDLASTQLSDEVKNLLAAAEAMQRSGPERLAGIDAVSSLLRSYGSKSDWSVAHYSRLAAKASIAASDFRRAEEVLSAARRIRPEDAELNFLQRIVSHQRPMLTAAQD